MVVNHRMWVVVLLTLMLSVLVAQEAPAQRTDTEQRVEQPTAEQVGAILDKLAEKLKVPAERLFAVMRNQVRVQAVTNTAWALLILVLVWLYWARLGYWIWRDDDDPDTPEAVRDMHWCRRGGGRSDYRCMGAVFTGLMLVPFFILLTGVAGRLMNPDYYALRTILSLFGGKG